MPLFFFNLVTPAGVEPDTVGLRFVSLDEAYLSANQAALEIAIDMLRERENPSRHRFEVRDEHGVLVLELPFSEVLQPGHVAKPQGPAHVHERLKANPRTQPHSQIRARRGRRPNSTDPDGDPP